MSYQCIRLELSTERDIHVLTQKLITVVGGMGGKRKQSDEVYRSISVAVLVRIFLNSEPLGVSSGKLLPQKMLKSRNLEMLFLVVST